MNLTHLTILGAVAMLCLAPAAQADVIDATYGARHVLQGNFENGGADTFIVNNNNGRRIGSGGSGGAQRVNQPVIQFALPTLTGGAISSANFSITFDTPAVNGAPIGFDAVLSLMNYDDIADFSAADFTEDSGALGNGTLVATFAAADVSNGGTSNFALSGAALTLLQGFYDGAGNPTQTDAFFRISTSAAIDTADGANDNDRFQIETSDMGSNGDLVTSFTITTSAVPEPSSLAIIGLAGIGMVVRRRRVK